MTLGLGIFSISFVIYIACFTLLVVSHDWWVKAAVSPVLGLVVGTFFVIGHDACHDAFTPHYRLNKLLGRLAFLPSFQPYAAWEWTHNTKHHGFTNVRGEDIVYAPFSPDEFARLPRWRQWAERVFRSPFGLGALYFFTIYLQHELLPSSRFLPPAARRRKEFQRDRILVLFFLVGQLALLLHWGRQPWTVSAINIVCGLFVPQAVFYSLMGFVTYVHHTHPKVAWYADRREFSFYRSQVCSTTHVALPAVVDVIFHRIMHHTSHHVDPHIPLYHLVDAQRNLEDRFEEIVHERFTLRGFIDTLRTCCLYDYEEHRWLDFNGVPTTESLFRVSARRHAAAQSA